MDTGATAKWFLGNAVQKHHASERLSPKIANKIFQTVLNCIQLYLSLSSVQQSKCFSLCHQQDCGYLPRAATVPCKSDWQQTLRGQNPRSHDCIPSGTHSHQLLPITQTPLKGQACKLVTWAVTGMNLYHSPHSDNRAKQFALDRSERRISIVLKTATVVTVVCDS